MAFKEAREKRYEFMTVEHLLLALSDNNAATKVLRACGVDVEKLREELARYLDESTPMLSPKDERETQPTLGFQRVLQRSVFHVQSSEKEVTEPTWSQSLASASRRRYFRNKQNITRLDVVNYISHGISKVHDAEESENLSASSEEEKGGENGGQSPLEAYATNLNQQALVGKIDPLIGRALEVERTIKFFADAVKTTSTSEEAGVGKTAIAEGLVKKSSWRSASTVGEHNIRAGYGRPARWHQIPGRL